SCCVCRAVYPLFDTLCVFSSFGTLRFGFLFRCYVVPPSLHSFPTRRSSDLSFTGEGSSGSAWLLNYKSAKRIGYLNGVTSGVAEDRKSTRLNSSHVKISYAVFCLKKKIA